jgi:glycerol-3-phosphate cytidylyltransferase
MNDDRSKKQNMVIGYTSGVFDLFHVGHLNILRQAKSLCDKLIVGVSTDELVMYKFKKAVIPFEERIEIVKAIEYVDVTVPQISMDKVDAWRRYKYDIVIVGDDWYQTEKWDKIEEELQLHGVRVIYIPYTKGTSSTMVNDVLRNLRTDVNES